MSQPRMKDIAAHAGVSIATVSRVLNDREGVSQETREAVRAAVELLGYERPPSSRRRRAGLAGLLVPELDNPIFAAFAQAFETELAARSLTPLLCTESPITNESDHIDHLLDQGVAGIVFVCGRHANMRVDLRRYRELRRDEVPIVLVNGFVEGLDVPFVSADDVEGVRSAMRHLHSLGHERIGCAMGPARYVPSRRKVEGFRQGAAAVGAVAGDELVVHSVYTIEGGRTATEVLLDRGVTAVVCGSDLMALGAVRAARARGLDVPRDLSVVGYDDSPLMSFTDPPLTTLRQDVTAMTRYAVHVLLEALDGAAPAGKETLFRTDLIARRSTGPAPRTARHG